MPTQEHLEHEAAWAKSGGGTCPYCGFKTDEHALYVEDMPKYAAKCALLRGEMHAWISVPRPQAQQQQGR